MNCKKCNTSNKEGAQFCKNCGNKLSEKKSTKKSRGIFFQKIKLIGVVFALVVLVYAGFSFKDMFSNEDVLSEKYLDKMMEDDKRFEASIKNLFEGNLSEEESKKARRNLENWVDKYEKVINAYVSKAQKIDFENKQELEKFVQASSKIKSISDDSGCGKFNKMLSLLFDVDKDLVEWYERETEKYCEAIKLSKKVDVDEDTEKVDAGFEEMEEDTLPVGYSIVSREPEHGEVGSVVVKFKGEEVGSGDAVVKEPVKGIKLKGSGKTEEVAKQAGEKLEEIFSLWESQKFLSSEILPFLEKEESENATEWERHYKNIIFNWKRFDNMEHKKDQVEFDKNRGSDKYPVVAELAYNNNFNGDKLLRLPLYYNAEKKSWESRNLTFKELFDIIEKQVIAGDFDADEFSYESSDSCKDSYFYDITDEIELEGIYIFGYNNFNVEVDGYLSTAKLTAEGFDDSQKLKTKRGGIDKDIIDYINNNKKGNLTVESFYYNSGSRDCRSKIDMQIKFFD